MKKLSESQIAKNKLYARKQGLKLDTEGRIIIAENVPITIRGSLLPAIVQKNKGVNADDKVEAAYKPASNTIIVDSKEYKMRYDGKLQPVPTISEKEKLLREHCTEVARMKQEEMEKRTRLAEAKAELNKMKEKKSYNDKIEAWAKKED